MEKLSPERAAWELGRLTAAVERMRHCQREFNRTRSDSALQEQRRAEQRVDELLRPRPQRELF